MIGKPTASLSSSLLARKGQARPAMRPQGFLQLSPVGAQEDLGWNDMGHDFQPAAPVPMPHVAPFEEPIEAPKPAVLRQIEALDEQLAVPTPEPEPAFEAEPVLARRMKREPVLMAPVAEAVLERVTQEVASKKAKAAFTLRLDHDRHLRLRLASAVTRRSAQQLVTQALDHFLESIGEVDVLARQIDQTPDHG
jgi:hypothetical protein